MNWWQSLIALYITAGLGVSASSIRYTVLQLYLQHVPASRINKGALVRRHMLAVVLWPMKLWQDFKAIRNDDP